MKFQIAKNMTLNLELCLFYHPKKYSNQFQGYHIHLTEFEAQNRIPRMFCEQCFVPKDFFLGF